MRWKHLNFGPNDRISPSAVSDLISGESDLPVAICSRGAKPAEAAQAEILETIKCVNGYTGLSAFLLDGEATGWLIGLAATVDIVIATEKSSFTLDGIGEEVAGYVAARLAHLVGKAHAMQLLIDGRVDVVSLQRWGLVTKLTEPKDFENLDAVLEGLLPGVAFDAAKRLKRVWTLQEGAEIDEAIAAERLEFQRCFEEGAAEDIAAYLQNLKKN